LQVLILYRAEIVVTALPQLIVHCMVNEAYRCCQNPSVQVYQACI
jgi:hypothetical protein